MANVIARKTKGLETDEHALPLSIQEHRAERRMLVGGRHTTVAQWLPWSRTFQGGEGRHAILHEELLQRSLRGNAPVGAVVELPLRLGRQTRTPR